MEPGRQLSHYRLVDKIGEGGMGVVWKAVDTNLDREVAIKVLPEALAADAERLARFEREAKVLASLNHPNVAAIFGLHADGGERFLAMELVAGEDLAQRLARGPLPVEDALLIAKRIAEGLEAAHKNGIVHRDLKPANVMLTPEREVKVLDFGLAKALVTDPVSGSSDPSLSPTLTSAGTVAGTILGTASYMSPEQAKGRPVDRRADVWSLGVILFEMLSGKQAFEGDSIPETLASLLKEEPDWSALPAGLPPSIQRLLRRCLRKSPHDRLHDVADARIVLDEALAGDIEEPAPAAKRASVWPLVAAVVVAGLAVSYAAFVASRPDSPDKPVVRLQVPGRTLDFSAAALPFALSPDGRSLAYVDHDGPATKLFVRRMDGFEVETIAGTEGAGAPFYSPDGEWIGFYAYGELKKISAAGGRPITLCAAPHSPGGATWLEDDTIVFSMAFTPTGLYRVSADGGAPETLTLPDGASGEYNFKEPVALPGGRRLLFTIVEDSGQQVALLSLEDGTHRPLDGVRGRARYLSSGHIVYGDAESLIAVPFDAGSGEITGPPFTALEEVALFQGGASFAVAAAGALAYLPVADGGAEFVWCDRAGNTTPIGVDDDSEGRPILSWSGKRLAVSGGTRYRGSNMHVYDLERGGRVRVPGLFHLQWSPDDAEIFTQIRLTGPFDLYRVASDGSGEPRLIFESENNSIVNSVSPDGQWLLFYEQDPATSRDIWALRLDGSGEAVPLLQTSASERAARFSPDGRWFAYASNASGRDEIYVRRFDPSGRNKEEHLVSTEGGREPVWSHEGDELFYRVGRAMMAVDVETGESFRAGKPRKLFEGNWGVETGGMNQMYDVHPDGRFVMVQTAEASNTINVVLNWIDELERRP